MKFTNTPESNRGSNSLSIDEEVCSHACVNTLHDTEGRDAAA